MHGGGLRTLRRPLSLQVLRAARAGDLPAIVRCREHDIGRTLDIGAAGLRIPTVNIADHGRALVQRVK